MQTSPFPYKYIAVEGNIGAGKTTFCKQLASTYNCRLILEEFADNPFLPYFYENPERYAFSVELFFMTERHKQLQGELAQTNIFQQIIISDYYFLKTLLFARNNLRQDEFRLFQRLFKILNTSFPRPELLVYLHRSIPKLLENIKARGRTYETDIEADYLQKLQNTYFEFFKTENSIPILIIDTEEVNFNLNPDHFDQMVQLIKASYPIGVHRAKVK